MTTKKPLLTISLLSSGRAKTIQKCLDSLVPLMNKVDSELIIVDTGCDEEIKKLMSEYTDKIVPFTWCDDFSAARNAGLKLAKGEWFMYIDDDEWFIDTKAIEDFFLTGEYKEYFYACYIQRNYLRYNKEIYTDAWTSRLTRLEKNTRFVSAIHEYFDPLKDPYKLLHSMVEHFGYIYDTPEEEKKHIKRNITLLLKMIDREKNTVRWWTHLLQEYRAAEEYSQMQELCRKGLEHFKNWNDYDTNRERGAFYCGMAEAQLLSAYYEKAEQDINKALTDKRNTQMCQMRLYNLAAEAYFKQGKFKEAEECCEKYIAYYELLKDDEAERQRQEAFFVMNAFEPSGKNSAFCFYILCGLYRKDTTALKKYFWEFGWNGVLMLYRGFIGELIDAMSELPYEEEFVRMAETMANRKGLNELWDKLLEMERKAKNSEEDAERFYHLARIFSQVRVPNHYVWYLRILYSDYIGKAEDWDLCYENMFHYVTDIFQLEDIVFSIAEKYRVDLGILFEKIPFDQWKLGVDSFFSHTTYEKILRRESSVKYVLSLHGGDSVSHKLAVRCEYYFMKTAEAKIVFENNKGFEALQESFRDFSAKSLAFYKQFYKKSAFQGEMELLTPSCRAAVRFHDLLEAQNSGDRQKIGNCLKAAVGVFPSFDTAIRNYAKLYAAQEKEKLNAEASISPEMRTLGEQIKGKIRVLLEQNMTAEAQQVLSQLKQLLPDDKELTELEEEIRKRLF